MKLLLIQITWEAGTNSNAALPPSLPPSHCDPTLTLSLSRSVHGFPAPPRGRPALVPGLPGGTRLPRLPFHAVHPPQLQPLVHARAVSVGRLKAPAVKCERRTHIKKLCHFNECLFCFPTQRRLPRAPGTRSSVCRS